jgi:hypothetical protein
VHEFWKGILKPRTFITYQFNSSFEINSDKHNLLCAEAIRVNNKEDDNQINNQSCEPLVNKFVLLDPFPNPAEETICFLYVLPAPGNVRAEIVDENGKMVEQLMDTEMQAGLNNLTYNAHALCKGMYLLRFFYNENSTVKKFIKKM